MNKLPRMRVLMTTDTVGGVWTYSTGLASALAETGVEVHLVTMGPPPRADQRELAACENFHLTESNLALEWHDPAGHDLPAARRFLGNIEHRVQPDLVHLNSF